MAYVTMTNVLFLTCYRYAYFGDIVTGHASNAWKHSTFVLLCLLYLWNNWCSALGRATTTALLS